MRLPHDPVNLESGYNADVLHEFSPAFEKKIRKLKRRADHPAFYRTMNRVASILLAILIAIGAWISVDAEARAAVVGWVKEIYELLRVDSRCLRNIFCLSL